MCHALLESRGAGHMPRAGAGACVALHDRLGAPRAAALDAAGERPGA